MDENCTCLNCSLARFFRDRFPDGFDADTSAEALTAIAAVAGWILAGGTNRSLKSFTRLLVAERDSYVAEERKPGGGLH